jgi:hypothetical protein
VTSSAPLPTNIVFDAPLPGSKTRPISVAGTQPPVPPADPVLRQRSDAYLTELATRWDEWTRSGLSGSEMMQRQYDLKRQMLGQ